MSVKTKLATGLRRVGNVLSGEGFEQTINPTEDAARRAAAKILQGIDRDAIARQVVNELDSEYSPMDESFDSITARRAAYLAMDKLVTLVDRPTEIAGGK